MSLLSWFALGVVHEQRAPCDSQPQSRMANNKKYLAKSPRSSSNHGSAGGHSPSRPRRSDDASQYSGHSASSRLSNLVYSGGSSVGTSALRARHIPYLAPPRELLVEVYMLIYLVFCLVLQNLNIYKQNWYLIDYDLVLFSVLVLGRTVLWRLLTMLGLCWSHAQTYKYWVSKALEILGKVSLLGVATYLATELLFSYTLPCCVHLIYPIFLYVSLFGCTLDPHQEQLRQYRSYPSSMHSLRPSDLSSASPSSANGPPDPENQSNTEALLSAMPSTPTTQLENLRHRHHPEKSPVSASCNSSPSARESSNVCGQTSSDARQTLTPTAPPPTTTPSTGSPLSLRPESAASAAPSSWSPTVSPPRSGAQVLTSSLLSRTLLPWRSWTPQAMVVISNYPSVSLSASTVHPMVSAPDWVRQEVECLWSDYLVRLKQIIFSTVLAAYYAGYLPMQIIRDDHLYLEPSWCWMHTGMILFNSFLMLSFQLLPAHYCGSLYRCAVQLGFWEVQLGQTTAPHTWSAMSSWPHGSVVRHPKGVFRASGGHATVAIPGDEGHESFYLLFTWALHVPMCYSVFASCLLLTEVFFLWTFSDYLQSLSLFLSLVFSLYPYYHLTRNSLILHKTACTS
eukprot:scpid45525/ scgid18037/ Transmembrane protein 39A